MLRELVYHDYFTAGIIICMVIITCSKIFFQNSFISFFKHCFSLKLFRLKSLAPNSKILFKILLDFNFVLAFVMLYLILLKNSNEVIKQNIYMWLKPLLIFVLFIVAKYLIEKLTAYIFGIQKLSRLYQIRRNEFIRFIGIVLIPIIVFQIYIHPITPIILYVICAVLLLFYVYGLYVAIISSQNGIMRYFFYFILYLCALEISPYIIVYKALF